ncbi:MAG: FAD-dependent oxidoreductase [Planctomycetota bacterium]|nr:FAD-dependent oxidoreductase [Planctomycetota bacterium]
MERTDVLIVGAGLAGASLAWHVAGRADVVALEQGDAPLGEASAQNAGMVRRFVSGAEERELACRSHERLAALHGHPDWVGAAPFRRTGAVIAFAARAPAWAEEAAQDLRGRGAIVEDLDAGRLADLAPALADSRPARAFFLPEEGVCDAWTLGQGLLRGAIGRGAELRCSVRVESLRIRAGRVVGVETSLGPVEADAVVLAAGAWGEALGRTAGSRVRLTPRARHLLQTREHPLANAEHPWCWFDDAGLYLRPEAGGFLCSPCDEVERFPQPGPGSIGRVDDSGPALTQHKLESHVPRPAGLRMRGGWTGLRTFSPDRRPILGEDGDVPGLFWVAGLGGFGLSCGLAAGAVAADRLLSALAPCADGI